MSEDAGQSTPQFETGQTVADRFEVINKIGSSEGGDVYLVRETESNQQMILKHLLVSSMEDEVYEALREEVKEASTVRHRTLGQVFGLGREGDAIFLAMEFIDGQTLTGYLKKRREQGRPMTIKGALNIILNLCAGLEVAHKAGLIHGALTPRNVYITNEGRVKITNLVYAKLVSRHLAGEERGIFFDSPFVSPETREDPHAEMAPTVDIYSMGMLCAEVLSVNSFDEWDGESIEFVAKVIEPHHETLQGIMLQAVLPDSAERHPDIQALKAAIKAFLDTPEGKDSGTQSVPSVIDIDEPLSGVFNLKELAAAAIASSSVSAALTASGAVAALTPSASGAVAALSPKSGAAPPPKPPPSGARRRPKPPASGVVRAEMASGVVRTPPASGVNRTAPVSGIADIVVLPDEVGPAPKATRRISDFDSAPDPVSGISGIVGVVDDSEVDPHEPIWLVQKDGLDYGPFNVEGVLDMLHKDEITEHNLVQNMRTQDQHPLSAIGMFHDAVLEHIPKREERLAREAAERERRLQQVKSASKFSGVGASVGGVIFVIITVIGILSLPDPVPTEFKDSIIAFPQTFALPRVEAVEVNLGDAKMEGLMDPNLSEEKKREARKAFRDKLLAKLAAEEKARKKKRRKRSGKKRRKRRSKSSASAGGGFDNGEDDVETLNMNSDAEPLGDYEIYEEVYSNRVMGKVERCVGKHGSGAKSVTVSFTIRPSGRLDRLRVDGSGSGAYNNCVKNVFRSLSFREFGGSSKKAKVPFDL